MPLVSERHVRHRGPGANSYSLPGPIAEAEALGVIVQHRDSA
jgi:hypothetical protein